MSSDVRERSVSAEHIDGTLNHMLRSLRIVNAVCVLKIPYNESLRICSDVIFTISLDRPLAFPSYPYATRLTRYPDSRCDR